MKLSRWLTAAVAALIAASSGTLAAGTAVAGTAPRPAAGPVPRGFEPASVTFVSASDGWVLGTAPCAHAPCTSVVRTTDGGKTWVGIPAPAFKLASYDSSAGLVRLRFADQLDGFAFGSQLWATHNGGASWHRVRQVPGYIVDLEASAGVVYAASYTSGRLAIYRSPAHTDSWRRVPGLPAVSTGGELGMITLHGTAAWIILGSRLYSSQAGSGWVQDSVTCPRYLVPVSVGAYSSRQITLLCVGDPAMGSTLKVLYSSSDGGIHFTRVGDVPLGGDGGLLAEPTPAHLFVATSSGATWLYVSTNGGRSWHQRLWLADGGKGWSDFGFTTATQGVAVEGRPALGSRMFLTKNAGATWQAVTF